jgi:hypothetical protein
MTTVEQAHEYAAPRSRVSVWQMRGGTARYSLQVVQGTTDAELDQLIDQAINAFRQVGDRLAAPRVHTGEPEPPPARFTDELAADEREDAELRGDDVWQG